MDNKDVYSVRMTGEELFNIQEYLLDCEGDIASGIDGQGFLQIAFKIFIGREALEHPKKEWPTRADIEAEDNSERVTNETKRLSLKVMDRPDFNFYDVVRK